MAFLLSLGDTGCCSERCAIAWPKETGKLGLPASTTKWWLQGPTTLPLVERSMLLGPGVVFHWPSPTLRDHFLFCSHGVLLLVLSLLRLNLLKFAKYRLTKSYNVSAHRHLLFFSCPFCFQLYIRLTVLSVQTWLSHHRILIQVRGPQMWPWLIALPKIKMWENSSVASTFNLSNPTKRLSVL